MAGHSIWSGTLSLLEDLLPLGLQTMCLLSFALNKNLGSHNCFKCVAHENVNITLGMCGSDPGNLQAYALVSPTVSIFILFLLWDASWGNLG